MPHYDFTCQDCGKGFEVFMTYAAYGKRRVKCPACGSDATRRRLNRVRLAKSDEARLDSLTGDFTDPAALAGLEDDPRAMGRMMRKMGSSMGEALPPEFNEVVERLEKGQNPEEIESDLPDPGASGDDLEG